MLRVFLTHNPADLETYFGATLPRLADVSTITLNPLGRDLTTDELIGAAGDCDIIVAHRSTPGERELFVSCDRLIAFLRTAVDISMIDIDAANDEGVLIARADNTFVASTAELALALMLDVARNVSQATQDYHRGRPPAPRRGRQLSGRTVGIIGYGAIGSYLAGMLAGLGMHVLVNDPYVEVENPGIRSVTLPDLLAQAEFIVPLASSSAETENLIGASELDLIQGWSNPCQYISG